MDSTKTVTFTVPHEYTVPDILFTCSPVLLSSTFDCIGNMLTMLTVTLSSTERASTQIEALKIHHHNEITRLMETFTQRLNDQKEQFLNERQEVVTSLKPPSCTEIQTIRHELHEKTLLLEHTRQAHITENERIQKLYEISLHDKDCLLSSFSKKVDNICSIIESFKSSTVSKGTFGENCMQAVLHEYFPSAELRDTSHIPHSGDFVFVLNDFTMMIEMKTKHYTTKEDVVKFENDVYTHRQEYDSALFVTSSTGIPNKGDFSFEIVHDVPVIYTSKILDHPDHLILCTHVLRSIVPLLHDKSVLDQNDMMQHIGSLVTTCQVVLDTVKQNTKTLGILTQQIHDQQQINDEKVQWCLLEITRITEQYKTQFPVPKPKRTYRRKK